jgi:hypothetical protein
VSSYYSDLRVSVIKDTRAIIDSAFNPLELKLQVVGDHYAILSGITTYTLAKSKEAHAAAALDIINSLDTEAQHLTDLGEQHQLTKGQVATYKKDVTKAYKAMGKDIPPEIQKVIKKLEEVSSYDGDHISLTVTTTYKQKGRLVNGRYIPDKNNASGYVGLTNGPTMTPVGWMGEAGTEAYAILKNPKPISGSVSLGGLGGGAPVVNLTYAPQYSTASLSEAQAFMRAIVPELTRELRRQSIL